MPLIIEILILIADMFPFSAEERHIALTPQNCSVTALE